MLLPEALFAHLSRVAPLTDLLRADASAPVRIYPLSLPQNATYPAVTYQVITDERTFHHRGRSGLQIARVQFSIWGADDESGTGGYASVGAVLQALHEELDGFDGAFGDHIAKCIPLGGRDLPGDGSGTYHHAVDFQIAFSE